MPVEYYKGYTKKTQERCIVKLFTELQVDNDGRPFAALLITTCDGYKKAFGSKEELIEFCDLDHAITESEFDALRTIAILTSEIFSVQYSSLKDQHDPYFYNILLTDIYSRINELGPKEDIEENGQQ